VRHAVEHAGFVGVKVYPTVGFLPLGNAGVATDAVRGGALDRALRALYATCEAEEIPITAHASPSNQFALGYGELAAPAHWAPVLREFPNLRLNFGHFGHETGADGAEGVEARAAWMRQAAELIDAHAHVYADLSSSPLVYDEDYAARFGAHLQSLCARFKRLPARLMYGSDWWLNRFEPGADTAVAAFQRRLGDWLGPGGRDAAMGRNALRFLGLLDEDDRLAPSNRNHQRLRAFYGAEPLPPWLA
jgi:predicted TIM-barrel fold metal-dependent hydrolase